MPEPAEGVVADGKVVDGVRIGAAGALAIVELDVESRKKEDCLPETFTLEAQKFDYVPIALLLGVPLMFQRLVEVPVEGEGAEELRYETKMCAAMLRRRCCCCCADDAAAAAAPTLLLLLLLLRRRRRRRRFHSSTHTLLPRRFVYKLMTTPGLGLPLTWNQNGDGTKLPPVLACRSDGVSFSENDWSCLCEFFEYLDENYVEGEQLWYMNKSEFKK